jgi:hypothetical protein
MMRGAEGVDLRSVVDQPVIVAILMRLWMRTACPVRILGPVEVVDAGAVPAVLPFEGPDPGFAAGPPLRPA